MVSGKNHADLYSLDGSDLKPGENVVAAVEFHLEIQGRCPKDQHSGMEEENVNKLVIASYFLSHWEPSPSLSYKILPVDVHRHDSAAYANISISEDELS
ncbi:hypothetical protein KIL84_009737 [Mauremys mutica]|uniref:Uncharacterized protein n=1 Tax=Mauremys mutica TaxID=74926 RepID=A0A9D3XLA5_9SAUR|nr:hypothetical protein KIL84_009737 [Mauremys mutica]